MNEDKIHKVYFKVGCTPDIVTHAEGCGIDEACPLVLLFEDLVADVEGYYWVKLNPEKPDTYIAQRCSWQHPRR